MVANNVFVDRRDVFIVLTVMVLAFKTPEDTRAECTVLTFARVPKTVAAEILDVLRRFTDNELTAAKSVEMAFVLREVALICVAVIADVDRVCVIVDSVRVCCDTVTVLKDMFIGYVKMGG